MPGRPCGRRPSSASAVAAARSGYAAPRDRAQLRDGPGRAEKRCHRACGWGWSAECDRIQRLPDRGERAVHTGWHGPRLATTRYRHLDLVTSDTVELPQRRGRRVGGDGAGAGGKDRGQDPLLPRRCDSRMAHDPSADRRQDTVAHQGSPPLATHS
jgi:hypothetical protein